MKRILAITLTICMVLSMVPAMPVAFAEQTAGIKITPESTDSRYAADSYQMSEKLPDVPRTVQTTIKLDAGFSSSSSAGVILGNYSYNSTRYLNLSVATNGNPKITYRANGGTNTVLFDKVDVRTGEYVDLAVVFDRTSGYWHCYIDGALKQSVGEYPDISDVILDMPFCVGGHFTVLQQDIYFKGEIKNIAMYSDSRSASEIINGLDTDDENLLAAYDLNSKQSATDKSSNNIQLAYYDYYLEDGEYADAISRDEYEYAFAVIGDPHTPQHGAGKLETMFQWIEDNKESKNIQYTFCVGDLSNNNSDSDWTRIKACFDMLSIPYSVVRGNHDFDVTGNDFTYSNGINFNRYFGTEEYKAQFTGENGGIYVGSADANSEFASNSIANTYRTFEVSGQKWLFLNFDFGAPDDVLEWADGILSKYPDHKAIVTTHGYLNVNGTRFSEPYTYTTDDLLNSGEEIWTKLLSKHANVEITLSGHHLLDDVLAVQDTGINGNTVTQIFTNPQQTNQRLKGLGLVTMLYFSKDGKTLKIEHYSTVRNAHFKICNQKTINLDADVTGVDKTIWDGTEKAPTGDGSQDMPYLVESAANLLWMSNQVAEGNFFEGKFFEQTKDIDLAGSELTSIGYYYNNDSDRFTFDGNYDGKGFAITNGTVVPVKSDASFTKAYGYGLFGAIYGATIKNVVVDKITVEGLGVTGVLVGKACGKSAENSDSSFNVVSNCSVKSNCKIKTEGTSTSTAFDDIERAGVIGGIVGSVRSATVEYCTASLRLFGTDEFNIIGGIAGTAGYNAVIDHCRYTGGIKLEAVKMTKEAAIGGIIGTNSPSTVTQDVGDAKSGSLVISNCFNNASMLSHTTYDTATYWGGIAGYIANLPPVDTRKTAPAYDEQVAFMIDNCHNRYAIKTTSGSIAATAGLVGKAYCASGADCSTLWVRDSSTVAVTRQNSGLNGYNMYNYKNNKTKYGFYPIQFYYKEDGTTNSNVTSDTDANVIVATAKIDSDIAVNEMNILGSVEWSFDETTGALEILGSGSMPNYSYGKTPWAEYTDKIKTVNISNDIITIGDYAFTDCKNLETVNLPANLIYIGNAAFDGTPFIENHTGWQNNLLIIQNVIVKASQSNDGNYTVPETVTAICGSAFAGITVDTITYGGNITEWNSVYIGIENESLENAQFIYQGEKINSRFDASTGTLTIFGTGSTPNYNDTSSNTPWYKYKDQVKSIVVESGITSLGNYLAKGFTKVESVTLPDGLTSIGISCFEGHAITEIKLPETLVTIGNYAFNGCSKLTAIDIPASVENLNRYAFYNNTALKTITGGEGITSMGRLALSGTAYKNNTANYEDGMLYVGSALALATQSDNNAYIIKEGTTAIAENAFNGLTVEKITFDGSAEQWEGMGIGAGNEALEGATIIYLSGPFVFEYDEESATLTITGKGPMENYSADLSDAPYYQYKLTAKKVVLSKGITSVGSNAFYGMTALETVELPEGITSIGSNAFRDSTIKSIDIPSTVTTIGGNAFYNIKTLTSIVIPEGVTTLGSSVFRNATNLGYVYIPSTVTKLPTDLFRSCTYLKTVDMYPTITKVEDGAFRACKYIEAINYFGSKEQKAETVKGTVTTNNSIFIGANFNYTIGYAFEEKLGKLSIYGEGKLPDYSSNTTEAKYSEYKEDIINVVIKDGITKIGDRNFSGCANLASITIPNSVTQIGTRCFENCKSLENIQLSDNVTSIGTHTFTGCTSLKTFEVPKGITKVPTSMFQNCKALETVKLSDKTTSIGEYAFHTCSSLTKIDIPDTVTTLGTKVFQGCALIENIKLPEGITEIPSYAFYGCKKLNTLYVPSTVKTIGASAFNGATAITTGTIYYNGLKSDFDLIEISSTSNERFTADTNTKIFMRETKVSATVNNKLDFNFKADKNLFEVYYTNPYVEFTFNGKTTKVDSFVESDGLYSFKFENLAPHMMGDDISATLYGNIGGNNVKITEIQMSLADYLKTLMTEYAEDTKLVTLAVDALNYGAAAQMYKGYNTENLVNASLTDEQKQIRNPGETESAISVTNDIEETAKWKNHSLYLEDSVSIKLGVESVTEDVIIIVKDSSGEIVETINEIYKTPYGRYYFYFENLNMTQLDEVFTFTVMSGDTQISETLSYSVASYVNAAKNDSRLTDIVNALLSYGRSAFEYKN